MTRSVQMTRFLLIGLLLWLPVSAAIEHRNLGDSGLALSGFDPVEYLDFGLALRGFNDIEFALDGALFRFRSDENRRKFIANPQRYLPAYGGWCPYGLSMDEGEDGYPRGRYPVDPDTFKIIDGRLHLFYNMDGFDALQRWNLDQDRYRTIADKVWRDMQGANR